MEEARGLIGGRSISDVIDTALDRLLRAERLRPDVAAYRRQPITDDEDRAGDLPVELDLGDEDVDYDKDYGDKMGAACQAMATAVGCPAPEANT